MTKRALKREAWKAVLAVVEREVPEWNGPIEFGDGSEQGRWEKAWSEVAESIRRIGRV